LELRGEKLEIQLLEIAQQEVNVMLLISSVCVENDDFRESVGG
jgi:hypothetical protein